MKTALFVSLSFLLQCAFSLKLLAQETAPSSGWRKNFNWVEPFDYREYTSVEQGGKYGLVNTQGKIVLPPSYDYAYPFRHGLAIVYKSGKFGVVDLTGKLVIPIEYERLELFAPHGLFNGVKEGKWGVVSKSNKVIVPFRYQFTLTDNAGFTRAFQENGPTQFYKPTGDLYPNPVASEFSPAGSFYIGKRSKGYNIFNKEMKRILEEDYYEIYYDENFNLFRIGSGEKAGVYDAVRQRWIVPMEYESVTIRNDGCIIAVVSFDDGPTLFFNTKGEKLFGGSFKEVEIDYDHYIVSQGAGWALMDHTGKFITGFDAIDSEFNQYRGYWAYRKSSGWGLVDSNGKTIFPFEYYKVLARKDVNPFSFVPSEKKDYAVLSHAKTGKVGVIDSDYQWIIPLGAYEDVGVPFDIPSGRVLIDFKKQAGGKSGLYDLTAKREYLKPTYENINMFGLAQLTEKSPFGYLNFEDLSFRLPTKFYLDIYFKDVDVAKVSDAPKNLFSQGKLGLGKLDNTLITPIEYDVLERDYETGWFKAAKNGRAGFIDARGRTVIPFVFKPFPERPYLHSFQKGHVTVFHKGEPALINAKGQVVATASDMHAPEAKHLAYEDFGATTAIVTYGKLGHKWEEPISVRIGNTVYDKPGAGYSDETTLEFSEGLLAVRRNGKFGYIDIYGKEVIACRFEKASDFKGGTAYVKLNGQWNIINRAGTILNHIDLDLIRLRKR